MKKKYKFHLLTMNLINKDSRVVTANDIGKGYKDCDITIEELIKSIITCGMPMYYLTSNSFVKRKSEILHKISAIFTILDFEKEYLRINDEKLSYLDPSEKSVLSYYLGMAMTKYISDKIYNCDYLVHLSIWLKSNSIIYSRKDKRNPDMIGYNIHDNAFSVFESKGRMRKRTESINRAIKQSQNIKYIDGDTPQYAVAQISFFKDKELYVVSIDPKSEKGSSIKLKNNALERYLEIYNAPIMELTEQSKECVKNIGYNEYQVELEKIRFDIRISSIVEHYINNGEYNKLYNYILEHDYVKTFNSDGIEILNVEIRE